MPPPQATSRLIPPLRAVTAQWLDKINDDDSLAPSTRELYERTAAYVLAGLGAFRLREVGGAGG